MARTQFTLAALVVSALPGFDPALVTPLTDGFDADFESALVADSDGRAVIVRLPTSKESETALSNELRALDVLTAGVRSRLGFDVPVICGRAPVGNTFGLVFDQLPGERIHLGDVLAGTVVPLALGRAIASIHDLPTPIVADAGLSYVSAAGAQQRARDIVERAVGTTLVPDGLAARWTRSVHNVALWQFEPTVVHGSLSVANFMFGEDSVCAVQGWSQLRVDDPAVDLKWLAHADAVATDEAFHAYHDVRLSAVDPHIRKRAFLYSELDIAQWLLHGIRERNTEVVDDAIDMMSRLGDTVQAEEENTVGLDTAPVLTVDEVSDLLDR